MLHGTHITTEADTTLIFEASDEDDDLRAWSAFARDAPGAGWGQVPSVARSYAEYGARAVVHLGRNDSGVIRCGALLAVFQPVPVPIRFAVCLGGPIVAPGQFAPLIAHLRAWGARHLISHLVMSPATPSVEGWDDRRVRRGSSFAPVRYPQASLALDVRRSDDELLRSFRSGTRRDVRYALKANQVFTRASTPSEAEAIALWIHDIHLRQQVPVRARSAFLRLATELVARGEGEVFAVRRQSAIVAAGLFAIAGGTMWYLSGAVDRADHGGYPAHLLHFRAITSARDLGLERYDFTSRSVPSVYAFKRGFRPSEYETAGEYELPIVWPIYVALRVASPWVLRHRRAVGAWIARLRGVRRAGSLTR